ncbi:MAG: hypothetical protein V2A79_09720 [Planctomycetota bacterium]
MAKQAAMNVIGQFSPDTIQFSAQRANRIMQAMQEQGATERAKIASQTQLATAAMQERGAAGRSAAGEAGATQRAKLGAETAKAGQQQQAQLTREQMAQSDSQQAAEIRARRESDEFNAGLQKELRKTDRDFENARFEKQKAIAENDMKRLEGWTKKEQDLNTVRSLLDYSLGAMNLRMTMGMIEKLAGTERAREGLLTARSRMERGFQSKTLTFDGIDKQIDARLADPQAKLIPVHDVPGGIPSIYEQANALFQPLTTALQTPISLDLFEPRNRDKLEQQAAGWDVAQTYAIRQSLTKLRDKVAGLKPEVEKRRETLGGKLKWAPAEPMVGSINEVTKKLDDALLVLDADLTRSTRALPDSPLTLGQQMTAYKMAHQGLTAEALTHLGQQLFPDDNQGFAQALEGLYRQPLTLDNPLLPEKLKASMSPEAVEMFNALWDSLGTAVPGVRQPVVYGPQWLPGTTPGGAMGGTP